MRIWFRRHRPSQWALLRLLPVPIFLLLVAGISPLLFTTASAAPAASCAGPVSGQHIYDCAGILTPSEVAYLQTQAMAVERAGAPNVVYLQVHAATAQETLQDAINLMNRWDVESHTGAHDGFVMFFNLQPGNPRHGEVALYAGAKYFQNGDLPQSELDRIQAQVMTPLLQQGQTADGIAAGLQAVAHDLRYGQPTPTVAAQVVVGLGRLPLTLLGLLFAAVVALFWVSLPRVPSASSGSKEVGGLQRAASPGDLPPGLAGALVTGRVDDAQLEGTVLDFAGRGLLVLEPLGATAVQVNLRGGSHHPISALSGYERETWESLVALAGSDHGTISSDQLANLHQNWSKARSELQRELIERGWYDPDAAATRRRHFQILGRVGLVAVVIALLLIVASNEGWAAIGMTLFLGASVAAFIRGNTIPDTTVEGEKTAAPWRAYQTRVTALEYDPKLDTDLPYIVALGSASKLAPRLKAASERGYSPSWFQEEGNQTEPRVGFYPYWIAFHSGMTPTSGGGAIGGYAGGGFAGGGGVASGGGGSVGRF